MRIGGFEFIFRVRRVLHLHYTARECFVFSVSMRALCLTNSNRSPKEHEHTFARWCERLVPCVAAPAH